MDTPYLEAHTYSILLFFNSRVYLEQALCTAHVMYVLFARLQRLVKEASEVEDRGNGGQGDSVGVVGEGGERQTAVKCGDDGVHVST